MSLVEVIVALSIITILGVAGGLAVENYVELRGNLLQESSRLSASEGEMEMVRFLRDSNWETIAAAENDVPYHITVSTSTIALDAGAHIDGTSYTSVVFSSVYRDNQENIVSATTPSAVLDSQSRAVLVTVADSVGTSSLRSMLVDLFQ